MFVTPLQVRDFMCKREARLSGRREEEERV
jgi:hypothetical protein